MTVCSLLTAVLLALPGATTADDNPSRADVIAALNRATRFVHGSIADHGGYAWTAGVDGKLRNGEGPAGPGTVWVQPPGTPAVGLAFLDAYEATGDPVHLRAATDAARALVNGQLRSGGWHYRIEFDPERRRAFDYRTDPPGRAANAPTPAPGGWDVWKRRQFKGNITYLDDDTTQAALRLLVRTDQALQFKDAAIHEAAEYARTSLRNAQYPNGAWSHNYDHFPAEPPSAEHYPVKPASIPKPWPRTWTRDFTGCYMLNDRISLDAIATLLLAYRVYGDRRDLAAAERGGRFLILAQLPDPQPAWAQQYNRAMQPVWDRKFEPPAVTGSESQDVLRTLLLLYRVTGNRDFLAPVPRALAYLKKCVLPDGRLARYYELETNRPLYFTTDYRLTYDKDDLPTHYAFLVPSRLGAIEAEYRQLLDRKPDDLRKEPPPKLTAELAATVRKVLAAQDANGGWIEPGTVRDPEGRKVTPKEGVVQSATFLRNVTTLCRYLNATRSGGG